MLVSALALLLPSVPSAAAATTAAQPAAVIVVLRDGVAAQSVAAEHSGRHRLAPTHIFQHALRGYAAQIPADRLAQVRADPRVLFVAEDREVRLFAQELPTGVDRIDGELSSRATATPGNWSISVAVIDTGSGPHPDLNVAGGTDCVRGGTDFSDRNGHGTHVAGTIGALNNAEGVVGVAPGVPIYSVRVLSAFGVGSTASAICGVDWVTANASALGIRVANMSFGQAGADDGNCGLNGHDALHFAICRSVQLAGVTYVAAAGNGNLIGVPQNLAESVPAAYDEVLTVTAMGDANGKPLGGGTFDPSGSLLCNANPILRTTERDDDAANFSNFATPGGPDTNHVIAAPGVCIRSTAPVGPCNFLLLQVCHPSGYFKLSGTSMASPHVAGTAAVCIAAGKCPDAPAAVIAKLRADAQVTTTLVRAYGFRGDPLHAVPNRYYGFLVRAGHY